jgi:hypothetical protein
MGARALSQKRTCFPRVSNNDRLRRRIAEVEAEIERLKGGRHCPPGWEPEGLWRHDLGRPQKDKGPLGAW